MVTSDRIENLKATWGLKLYTLWKIPLLFFVRPKVLCLDEERCIVEVPFIRRNKNHLNCMYFGALSIGAELTGGLWAINVIKKSGKNVSLIFKDFKADFLKRVEGPAQFRNLQSKDISEFVAKAIETKERMHMTVNVEAFVPSKLGEEVVARFNLTLSLKAKE